MCFPWVFFSGTALLLRHFKGSGERESGCGEGPQGNQGNQGNQAQPGATPILGWKRRPSDSFACSRFIQCRVVHYFTQYRMGVGVISDDTITTIIGRLNHDSNGLVSLTGLFAVDLETIFCWWKSQFCWLQGIHSLNHREKKWEGKVSISRLSRLKTKSKEIYSRQTAVHKASIASNLWLGLSFVSFKQIHADLTQFAIA